jgi:hypothetical protein
MGASLTSLPDKAELFTRPFDAIVHPEGATTLFGEDATVAFFQRFEDELHTYWERYPDDQSRIGQVYITAVTRPDANCRYIIHCPIDPSWADEPPLDKVIHQIQQLVAIVRRYKLGSLGLFGLRLGLWRGGELRGILLEAFRDLDVTISICEPAAIS